MDTTIRLWKLPAPGASQYGSYDPSSALQTLEGHTDIVWDLVLLPSSDLSGKNAKENRLVSASADGTMKLWTLSGDKWSLKASFSLNAVPTCLSIFNHDYGKVLVGLTNGQLKLWDIEAGEEVMSFGEVLESEFGLVRRANCAHERRPTKRHIEPPDAARHHFSARRWSPTLLRCQVV